MSIYSEYEMAVNFKYLFIAKKYPLINDSSIIGDYKIFMGNTLKYVPISTYKFNIGSIRGDQLKLSPRPQCSMQSGPDSNYTFHTGLIRITGQAGWFKGKNYRDDRSKEDLIAINFTNANEVFLLIAPQVFSKGSYWSKLDEKEINDICDKVVELLKPNLFDI